MNEIDRQFAALVAEIQGLSEKELYHRIRANFDQVPYAIQKSCMDFFNQFNYWGRLDPQQGIYEEIEGKGAALFHHIQDFAWLYDHLADYRSKKTLYAILNNWYRYDFLTTAQTKESLFDDYFDLDLVTCTPEEVFVETEGRIRRWEKSFESREQLLELIRQQRDAGDLPSPPGDPGAVPGYCVPPEGRGGCRGDPIPGEPPDQRLLQHPGARNRGGSPRDHLGHGHSRAHHHDQGGH